MIATAAHREGGVDLRALPEPEELGEGGLEHPWIPPEAKPWESSDDPAAEWRWGLSTADRFVRWGLALVRDAWADPPPAVTLTALSEASVTLSACLVELHEMSTRFSEQVAAALGDNALVLDDLEVLRLADASFRVAAEMDDGMKGSSAIGEIVAAAADAMVSLRPVLSARLPALPMDTGEAARALILAQLQVDVVERAAAPAMAPQPGPRFRFHRFDLDAPTSFLMQGLNPKQKLTGTKLNHFGAFFKRVWRAYDWTWGRLDGASHLIETVVTDRAICRVAASSGEQLERLRECLTTIVPDRESDIDRTLQQVQQSCRETGDPPPASMEQLRGWLTAAFHRAILLHELPAVLGEWGDDAPPGLPALGVGSPDADLRQVWRAMYSDFTKTSIKDLTSSSKGRAIAGESIASALRALTLDEHVPNAANSHLRRAARAVRLGTHPRVTRLRRMLRRLNPRRW